MLDMTGPQYDAAVAQLVRTVEYQLQVTTVQDHTLAQHWASALVTCGNPSLRVYRAAGAPYYGVQLGGRFRRRDFGIGDHRLDDFDQRHLLVHATGAGSYGGFWYFIVDSDGDMGINHNGQPCSEHNGLGGYELMLAVLRSVLEQ